MVVRKRLADGFTLCPPTPQWRALPTLLNYITGKRARRGLQAILEAAQSETPTPGRLDRNVPFYAVWTFLYPPAIRLERRVRMFACDSWDLDAIRPGERSASSRFRRTCGSSLVHCQVVQHGREPIAVVFGNCGDRNALLHDCRGGAILSVDKRTAAVRSQRRAEPWHARDRHAAFVMGAIQYDCRCRSKGGVSALHGIAFDCIALDSMAEH